MLSVIQVLGRVSSQCLIMSDGWRLYRRFSAAPSSYWISIASEHPYVLVSGHSYVSRDVVAARTVRYGYLSDPRFWVVTADQILQRRLQLPCQSLLLLKCLARDRDESLLAPPQNCLRDTALPNSILSTFG
jgi:hypothetical protein